MRDFRSNSFSGIHILDERRYWNQWERTRRRTASQDGSGRVAKKEIEVDYSRYNPNDYLLTWTTAVAGVETEDDGYTIVTPHNKFINDNGNAWKNEVLLTCYPSFILAENFAEHLSLPELSKGKVLDAVAWVVEEQFNGYREPIPTIFIDILIATSKKRHPRLVKNIQRGIVNSVSMGGDLLFSQCSKCGKIIEEGVTEPCKDIKNDLGRYYNDKDKKRRRVSELCGIEDEPESFVFKEISWVAKPAFASARLHGFIEYGQESTGRPVKSFVPYGRYRESNKDI